jgi:FkbM family methyltransferase
MNLYSITYRVYFAARSLRAAGLARRVPVVSRAVNRLIGILLPQNPVWVQVRSGISQGLWMRLHLPREARIWRGEHEVTVQDAILVAVFPGTVLYDVGAHLGSIALGAARLVGESGRVVAFEADPQNVEKLRDAGSRNNLTASLTVVPFAVWSHTTSAIPFRRGGTDTSHGGVENDGQRPVLGSGEIIHVPAVSLDDFIAQGAPIPQLVKIDVEGGEYEVLQGGAHLFETQRPLIVAEVHHGRAATQIGAWLTEYRYGSRWIVPRENFPRCLFAWPEEYHGVAGVWDGPATVD